MADAERPKDKVPIPGAEGWLRVTTTHGNVFYAQKKTKRSEWTIPEEIRPQVLAFERSMGIVHEEDEDDEDEAVEARQVKRARMEEDDKNDDGEGDEVSAEQAAAAMDPVPTSDMAPASPEAQEPEVPWEEAKAQYMDMLTSLNGTPKEVNPLAPWDRELPKFVHHPSYRILPTLQDREDVFNEWCKFRLREKREKARENASEDKFKALLQKQVQSTRTEFSAFRERFGKDPTFQALVRDKSEARAEQLFRSWLHELGEIKLRKAKEAEDAFLVLLSESLSASTILREQQASLPIDKETSNKLWATSKKIPGLAQDPRYDAVGSATRRAELFQRWLSTPASSTTPAPTRLSKAERQALALEQREAQVRRERARHQHHATVALTNALDEQREQDFQQLLIDTVRDPWLIWEDAIPLLSKDARFAPARQVRDSLRDEAKQALFAEHIQRLQRKRRDQLARLFAKHAEDDRGVLQLSRGSDVILPLVRADEAYIQSGLPRFVGEDAGVHKAAATTSLEAEFEAWDQWRQQQARDDFFTMLRENAFVDFWGRLRKEGEGKDNAPSTSASAPAAEDEDDEDDMTVSLLDMASQLDLQAMESVLKVCCLFFSLTLQADKRYKVFAHRPEERTRMLHDHLRQLNVQKKTIHQHHIGS